MIFYDTCSLLNNSQVIGKEEFAISNITLKELEEIKTSKIKDENIKHKAKEVIRLLNLFDNYTIVNYQKDWDDAYIKPNPILIDNNDTKIIISAFVYSETHPDLIFATDDLSCRNIAKSIGLTVKIPIVKNQGNYTGYIVQDCHTTEEVDLVYDKIFTKDFSSVLENEYVVIKQDDTYIDAFVRREGEFKQIQYGTCKSKMFGEVKPLDIFQKLALESLKHNQITVLRGKAGTGKSYLALGYLFNQLENGNINKIIIFCNTVATAGSAKLGFYPGSRTEKLLDSQIGNFLISKLGDRIQIERMIAEGTLILLPMSDIRGFDTTGMNAGIYITEAQNLNIDLMKLALQRIGDDSICILDGDDNTQVDLPIYANDSNGLRRVSEVFRGSSLYGEVTLPICHRSKIAELAEKM